MSNVHSVDALIANLRDGRATVRAEALRGLAATKHTGPELVPFLRDTELHVALAAAEALVELGVAQKANVVAIANALDGAKRAVCDTVERFLSELVGRADAELLQIFDAAESVACKALVRACGRLGPGGLHFLQRAARDDRPRVRINAAFGVGAIGELEAVSSMALLFELAGQDDVADVRSAAQRAGASLAQRLKSLDAEGRRAKGASSATVPAFEQRELTAAEYAATAKTASLEDLLRALTNWRSLVRINALRILAQQGREAIAAAGAVAPLLRDDETNVRLEAARALGKLGAPYVAAALARALGDPEPDVVAAVAQAIAELGTEPAVVDVLVDSLDIVDEAHGARLAALIASMPDGVRRLADALASTTVEIRINAALGIASVGRERAAPALSALVAAAAPTPTTRSNVRLHAALSRAIAVISPRVTEAPSPLTDPDPAVRARAVASAESVDVLRSSLRDEEVSVRLAAARALDKLGTDAVGAAAAVLVEIYDGHPDIAAILTAHSSAAVDQALVQGLDRDDLRGADRIIDLILARASAPDVLGAAFQRMSSRANAARGLIKLGKEKLGQARAVLEHARASASAAERDLARSTLDAIDGPPVVPSVPAVPGFETELLDDKAFTAKLDAAQLLPFTRDGRAIVRANAVTALGTLGNAALASTIGPMLRDDDARVRIAAARALGRLGDDAVIATARQLVAALRDETAVADAVNATLAPRKDKLEDALIAGLETDDEAHGLRVAQLVATLPNARELLFAAFDGEAQNVQINAAFGIALLGTQAAGPAGRRRLVEGMAGPHNRRRSAMEKALRMLDGR
ncbi:MAG: HEAT repeat domain-containing protein [Kofleriaceae bacterium]|nr:HEAT repeat domain-containing protein [Kofleriaceae bacterium]